MKISLGCDHAGFPLKQKMVEYLHSKGHEVIDNGCFEGEVVDFPQIAKKVCGYKMFIRDRRKVEKIESELLGLQREWQESERFWLGETWELSLIHI